MKRTESSEPWRLYKDANAPQWMTPQYFTTEGIVRNRVVRTLVVSVKSGTVFQDISFSAADRRLRLKRPYIGMRQGLAGPHSQPNGMNCKLACWSQLCLSWL